jgi:hypothetical protein
MTRVRCSVLCLLAALLLPAASARASAYTKVLASYQHTGSVPACTFSSAQLESALKGVDTYGAQYFADFTNAIQAALAQRASGQCVAGRHAGPIGLAGPAQGSRSVVPGSVTAATGADLPAPLVLLALFGVVLDLAWAVAWRHSWSEAGYRMGGTWADFRDWLRSA